MVPMSTVIDFKSQVILVFGEVQAEDIRKVRIKPLYFSLAKMSSLQNDTREETESLSGILKRGIRSEICWVISIYKKENKISFL